MRYPRPTSSQKGDVVSDARSSNSPTPLSLDVPSPEHAWAGVELTRTLDGTPAGGEGGAALGAARTSAVFSFPFNPAAGRPLPSFAPLLPTRRTPLWVDTTSTDGSAHVPKQKMGDDDAVATAPPGPPRSISKPLFPSVPASRAAIQGCGKGHEGAAASAARRQAQLSQGATSPLNSPLSVPSVAASARSRNKRGFEDVTPLEQRLESPVGSSFTELFVGLERPRLRGRRPREGLQRRGRHRRTRADGVFDVEAQASLLSSSSLSLHQVCSTSNCDGTFSDEDDIDDDSYESTTEDEDGANTPTVYCSPQLPHWWRSIATPVPGTRVSLRPDTCRHEFWWIDRLGFEAHEIVCVVLKHSLEGVVLRRSGETAVVVEFRILPKLLKSTSYVVARRSRKQRDASPSLAADASASESPKMPFTDSARSLTPTVSLTGSQPVDAAEAADLGDQRIRSGNCGSHTVGMSSPDVCLQLPQLVRADSSGKAECSQRELAEPATSTANGTTTIAATTITTTITATAGSISGQLTSPSSFPLSPKRPTRDSVSGSREESAPTTQVSVRTSSPRSPLSHLQQPEATGSFSTLSPSAHPSHSHAVGSIAVTVARRSADSLAAQDPQRPVLARALDTTTTQQQHQSLRLPVAQASAQTGAVAAVAATVKAAKSVSGNGEAEVDASATNGGGVGGSARPLGPTRVKTNVNGSSTSVLPVAMPPVRRLIQESRPATKLDTVHNTSIIGGADDVVASVEPTSSMGTQGSLCYPSPWRPSPQPQLPCGELLPTVKVNSMATNGTGSGSSHSCIRNNHSGGAVTAGGGDAHLSSISEEKTFLFHVELHHNLKNVGVDQRRNGSPVVVPPAAPASNPLPSASSHSGPALPGNSNSDWQHGSQRSQQPHPWTVRRQLSSPQPHHQHTLSSPISIANLYPDTTEKVVMAAAEAARLEDAVVPTTTAAATSSQQQPAVSGTPQRAMDEDDDSVVAILTLPISVCTPIVVARLHAMRLLHPLLSAITALHGPAFSASISGDYRNSDNTDTDSSDEALVTAPQPSNAIPPSPPAADAQGPDYPGAIRLLSEAIELFKEEKSAEEASPSMMATPDDHAPTRARDLSILYTVRSHLLFHASPTCLRDSLQDAEAALRCCPSRDHINPTYEVLAANLISFGYVSQVEALAGHLRHRWRAASPLLLRLGRVTQVMVSYASIFLRQQIPTSTLRLCAGGSANMMLPSNTSDTAMGSPSLTAMSLSPRSTPLPTEHTSSYLSHRGDERSSRPGAAATTATANALLQAHTLPCEVCPLPLGRHGRTLHNLDEPPRQSSPISTSPQSLPTTGADGAGADSMSHLRSPLRGSRQSSRPFRPGADVCHRRLFLLEMLFPSMSPAPVNPLPLPVSRGCHGATGRQGWQPHSTKMTISGGNNNATSSNVVIVPKIETTGRVRAEDFMYDRNSMLALLAATADMTMQWGTVPMCYFCRHIRLSATRRIQKDEVIFLERPAVLMPFWPLLPPRSASASTGAAAPRSSSGTGARVSDRSASTTPEPSCCAQCGRQGLAKPVKCPGGCHAVYCSEQCRQLALRLYHVVECGGVPPDPNKAGVLEPGDDVGARVRRTVAVLQDVFSDWNSYLRRLARWDTPSTRLTVQHAACSPVPTTGVSPVSPSPVGEMPVHDASQQRQPGDSSGETPAQGKRNCAPPPILAVTAMRVVARLEAMVLSLALPLELLPQMQNHPAWTAERHAMMRAVARTLRQRGLMVPASTTRSVNLYCTHVDPQRLLLLEVLLQQLSVPFFADFNYRASSTVWERLSRIPCEVARSSDNAVVTTGPKKSVASPVDGLGPGSFRRLPLPHTPSPMPAKAQQQRNCFVELTPAQLEELLCDLHRLLHRVYQVVAKELADVPSIPLCGAEAEEKNNLDWGLPGRWSCVELLSFLNSTRAFQQISDFALTSWAVVYPRDMEPPNVAAAMAADQRSMSQARTIFVGDDRPLNIHPHHHHHSNQSNTITNEFSHANPTDISNTVAVPLVVISPWSCLTVDLHPILGNVPGGVIHSRFMIEHEQRRRMLAYCAAAAGRRGGDGTGGSSVSDDSFLSVHSASSTSAAALLTGDDSARTGSLRDDLNLQLLEEAAQRSCSNLHISLVYTPSKEPAVLAVAKKNITHGDVLWWESLSCREYLSALL